ncbi:hypothetical protein Mapa_011141 [Marchantia paleacea]|nr:hypothetical protein Mapa_011141 [Marchantia paleacea]
MGDAMLCWARMLWSVRWASTGAGLGRSLNHTFVVGTINQLILYREHCIQNDRKASRRKASHVSISFFRSARSLVHRGNLKMCVSRSGRRGQGVSRPDRPAAAAQCGTTLSSVRVSDLLTPSDSHVQHSMAGYGLLSFAAHWPPLDPFPFISLPFTSLSIFPFPFIPFFFSSFHISTAFQNVKK